MSFIFFYYFVVSEFVKCVSYVLVLFVFEIDVSSEFLKPKKDLVVEFEDVRKCQHVLPVSDS
mgnify:CR=1 FL=1